jgi:hypothetical protein
MKFREPVRGTLRRTGRIAIVGGLIFAGLSHGWVGWPLAALLMLWPSLGGHFVELWFLNWLRPRLSRARSVQSVSRMSVWFLGGICLMVGVTFTPGVPVWFRPSHLWIGGFGFAAIELLVHLPLLLRGRPSFYDGRG